MRLGAGCCDVAVVLRSSFEGRWCEHLDAGAGRPTLLLMTPSLAIPVICMDTRRLWELREMLSESKSRSAREQSEQRS